jgi:hypothetical protein
MTADNVQICGLGAEAVGDELAKSMQKQRAKGKGEAR